MPRQVTVLSATITALCLAVSLSSGAVPKLLILEHFTDYFG
jgi:hypothetical protein